MKLSSRRVGSWRPAWSLSGSTRTSPGAVDRVGAFAAPRGRRLGRRRRVAGPADDASRCRTAWPVWTRPSDPRPTSIVVRVRPSGPMGRMACVWSGGDLADRRDTRRGCSALIGRSPSGSSGLDLAVTNRGSSNGASRSMRYFADLERLFDAIPGLGAASIDVAFIDLAGFGVVQQRVRHGTGDRGPSDIRASPRANPRARWRSGTVATSSSFSVHRPAVDCQSESATFRSRAAAEFAESYGTGVVAPRVLTASTTGAHDRSAERPRQCGSQAIATNELVVRPSEASDSSSGTSMTSWKSPVRAPLRIRWHEHHS